MHPNPELKTGLDFIPETENVLDPATGAGYFFAHYMIDAISKVKQFDRTGKLVREITFPGAGTASGFAGKKDDKDIYYSFTNYITPTTIYRLNPETEHQ